MVSQTLAYFNSERIALGIKNYFSCFTEAKILEYLLLEKLLLNEEDCTIWVTSLFLLSKTTSLTFQN